MHNHYLSISPILSEKELTIFQLFNDVCEYNMELKQPQGYSVWLHDRKGSLKDGFEIIHPKKSPIQLADDYNESFKKLTQYSSSSFLKENLNLVMNYQSIFLRTKLIHKNSLNYQFDFGSGGPLSHLIKMVNIFHKDGFLKEFLELDIEHHDLSQVITDSQSHEAFIIEGKDIYTAELLSTGYYTRKEKISDKWCKDLLEVIHKKALQDKLQLLLSHKEKTVVQKI
jgi:hypothetical protein